MAIITFNRNEIISAINGSGIIERSGVKIEFNNCYINDSGNPNIKAEINDNLPSYHTKGSGGNIENGRGFSNYRYLKDYGTVKISCNNSLIVRVAGLYGADNHHIYNPSYKNINGTNYKFVSSGVKDVTFLPTIDWIYGCKKDNIEYRTFWDDNLADNGEAIVHVDDRSINSKIRLGYQNSTTNDLITINADYIVESNVISVDPSSYPYICRITKIHGNVLPQQLNTDEEVYMLPVLALSVDEDNNNQFYITPPLMAKTIGDNNGNIIVVTDDTFEQIEGTTITVNALEGAELDIENNCYTRKIIAPEGTMFNEITIKTYFEDKLIDPLYKDNTRFIPQTQTFVSINPTVASNGKLIREVKTVVQTETATVDVVADGTETANSYEHIKTASEGKLLNTVKSVVYFEDSTVNVLEKGQSYKDNNFNRYVRNPYTANGKLIRKVTPYVDIKNPTIKASDVLNGETINNTGGSLIDTIDFNGLTTPLTIDTTCIKDHRYELSDTKLIRYPIYMNIIKTSEAPAPDDPESISDIMSIASIEKREITFVEPRVPTVYYGIYIQLLQRMSKVAPELLKDCNCKCNGNINQKLINLWTMFHYACAAYMDDKDSKVAANIIKTIVSQLNIMYKDGEDWLKAKYYVGVYKGVDEPGEFEHISIYSLIPKEIDVCSEKDLSYELYHTDEVHYLILPPNIELEKAWYEENGDIMILFDKEKGIDNYNIRYHKFDDFEKDYKVYWYGHDVIKNPINIKLNLINNK